MSKKKDYGTSFTAKRSQLGSLSRPRLPRRFAQCLTRQCKT